MLLFHIMMDYYRSPKVEYLNQFDQSLDNLWFYFRDIESQILARSKSKDSMWLTVLEVLRDRIYDLQNDLDELKMHIYSPTWQEQKRRAEFNRKEVWLSIAHTKIKLCEYPPKSEEEEDQTLLAS